MFAFQVTDEDMDNVLRRYGAASTPQSVDEAMSELDLVAVEQAALAVSFEDGDDDESVLGRQTEAAMDEVAAQLLKVGTLCLDNIVRANNTSLLQLLRARGYPIPA